MDVRPTLFLFDSFDEPKGMVGVTGEIVHTEQIKGGDILEFRSEIELGKGDRILWHDDIDDCWREHIVKTVKRDLGICAIVAEGALFELRGDYLENVKLKDAFCYEAIEAALAATRWVMDENLAPRDSKTIWFYHETVLDGLREIEEKYRCELYTKIEVSDGRVSRRILGAKGILGTNRGARFTYAKNMTRCCKTVLEDDVYTALYGWGAGTIVFDDDGYWTGGYSNRVSLADANGGVPWVGSESARETYGIWNKDRTEKVHRFGEVIFPDEDHPLSVYNLTVRELGYRSSPLICYEVDVRLLEGSIPVGLGDTVSVIDTSFEPEQRFTARALKRVRRFGRKVSTTVELETLKQATKDKSKGKLIARASDVVLDAEIEGKTDAEIAEGTISAYLESFELDEEEF